MGVTKIAMLLAGLVRKQQNINILKAFIGANGDVDIDIYICTYDVIGIQTKDEVELSKNSVNTDIDHITDVLQPRVIEVVNYVDHITEVEEKFNSKNWNLIKPDNWSNKHTRVNEPITVFLRCLAQYHMLHKCLKLISNSGIEYDGIFKNRFDIHYPSALKISQFPLDKNVIYGTKIDLEVGFPCMCDRLYFGEYGLTDSLEKVYNLDKLHSYVSSDLAGPNGISKHGRQLQYSIECTMSYQLFCKDKLELRSIIPRTRVNRRRKYR